MIPETQNLLKVEGLKGCYKCSICGKEDSSKSKRCSNCGGTHFHQSYELIKR